MGSKKSRLFRRLKIRILVKLCRDRYEKRAKEANNELR